MTIVFTSISLQSDLIVMNVDSAVTKESAEGGWTEYDKGRKAYWFPGVGCVTTWGARNGNKVGQFLADQKISASKHTVDHLADFVNDFLRNHFRPHEEQLDDVGYHVAGFDKDQQPKLSHIFWGRQRPPGIGPQLYDYQTHISQPGILLFNGRNDLAQMAVNALLEEARKGKESNFNLVDKISLVRFSDFVTRFAAELTPEVDKPFFTFLISPENNIEYVKNDDFSPISVDHVFRKLVRLGYRVEGNIYTDHEITIRKTVQIIESIISKFTPRGILVSSPVNNLPAEIHFDSNEIARPDIFWTTGSNGKCELTPDDKWFGPPNLIVEVLSQDTQYLGRHTKYNLYEKQRIDEYWLIDSTDKFIEVFRLEKSEYKRVGIYSFGESFVSWALNHSEVDTTELLS